MKTGPSGARVLRGDSATREWSVRPVASSLNDSWSMDIVADSLFNGRRFRALTDIDNWNHECFTICVDQVLKGEDVVEVMPEFTQVRDRPKPMDSAMRGRRVTSTGVSGGRAVRHHIPREKPFRSTFISHPV